MNSERGRVDDPSILFAWMDPAMKNSLLLEALAAHRQRDLTIMREAADSGSTLWESRLAAFSRFPAIQSQMPGCGGLHAPAQSSPEDLALSCELAVASELDFQGTTAPTQILHFPLSGITLRQSEVQPVELAGRDSTLSVAWGDIRLKIWGGHVQQMHAAGIDWSMEVLRSISGILVDNRCFALSAVVPPDSAILASITSREEETLKRAFHLLSVVSPALLSELSRTATRVVPLVAMPGSNDSSLTRLAESFSSRDMPSTIFASLLDPVELVHLVTHEYHHLKLFLLEEWCGPLTFDPTIPVMAPWRPDIRRVNGLIHGIYVFWQVAKLFASIYDAFPPSRRGKRRLIMWNVCTERALSQLQVSEARLTPIGGALIRVISEDIARRVLAFEIDHEDDVKSLRKAVDEHLATSGVAGAPEPSYLLQG